MNASAQQLANSRTTLAPDSFGKLLIAMMVIGVLSVLISIAGRMFGGQVMLGGNSISDQVHEIVIANAVLNVPVNRVKAA